jgi:hypothetical protein
MDRGTIALVTEVMGLHGMTANDFFLLFIAFGGFVFVPALLLWVFSRVHERKTGATRGPDKRPDAPDAPTFARRDENAGSAGDLLRRTGGTVAFALGAG